MLHATQPLTMQTVFGRDGLMARQFAGYEPRTGQLDMAIAVEHAIALHSHLLVEAGTGTGKSRAYLVPAIASGQRVLVATANIALQEQLVRKDLPALQRELPIAFAFALLKGRNNYVCKRRFETEVALGLQSDLVGLLEPHELQALLGWCAASADGDISDCPVVSLQLPQVWQRLTVTSDACIGASCPHRGDCFGNAARSRAADANIIVTNYHLLLADIVVRSANDENDGKGVLPPFDVAICDEAHKLSEIARDFFGDRLTKRAIERLASDAQAIARKQRFDDAGTFDVGVLARKAGDFFDDLLQYRRSPRYSVRLRESNVADASELLAAFEAFDRWAGGMANACVCAGRYEPAGEIRALQRRGKKHAAIIQDVMALGDADAVYFLEDVQARSDAVAICKKFVNVAPQLGRGLFDRHCVVSTSATLTVGGSFASHKRDIGCDRCETLQVASPFDLQRSALLIVPAGISAPNEAAFKEEVPALVSRIVNAARGRTLALFTSNKGLQAAAAALRADGTAARYRVLVQGEGPRSQLIEAFRDDTASVLLGTASFWEGVDVQGEALSCVVIDRLPFTTPDDPVTDVIAQQNPRSWFSDWSLPRAVISFRQGFGRLIRSTRDRGVVVCLDRRLVDKSYGKTFLRSIGGVPLSRNLGDVACFLDTGKRQEV